MASLTELQAALDHRQGKKDTPLRKAGERVDRKKMTPLQVLIEAISAAKGKR